MKIFEEMPEEAYQKEEVPAEVLEQWLEEDIATAEKRKQAAQEMKKFLDSVSNK